MHDKKSHKQSIQTIQVQVTFYILLSYGACHQDTNQRGNHQILIDVLPLSLQCCLQYHVMLDRVTTEATWVPSQYKDIVLPV